jgi:hypothetical protein
MRRARWFRCRYACVQMLNGCAECKKESIFGIILSYDVRCAAPSPSVANDSNELDVAIDSNGFILVAIDSDGFILVAIDSDGFILVAIDSDGFILVAFDSDGLRSL